MCTTYISFIQGNYAFRSQLPLAIFALQRNQRFDELERGLKVEQIWVVIFCHVDRCEVNFEFSTIWGVSNGEDVVFGWIADTVADKKDRIMPRTFKDLKLCRIISVAVSSLRVVFHLGFARTVARHHPLNDDSNSFAPLRFKAINAAGKVNELKQKITPKQFCNFSLQIYSPGSSKKEHITVAAKHNWLVLWVDYVAHKLSVTSLVVIKRHAVLEQINKLVVYLEV